MSDSPYISGFDVPAGRKLDETRGPDGYVGLNVTPGRA